MADGVNLDDLIEKERKALKEKVDLGLTGEFTRGAGLAARALGPIATGAALGAAAGAPLAGVGAIPGALAGATSAALAGPVSDLLVSGYRAAKDYLTPQQRTLSGLVAPQAPAPLPSQAFENLMTAAGLPVPQTPGERIASTALRSTAEALTGAGVARNIAQALPATSQMARPIAEQFAAMPGRQAAAGGIAGASAQGAVEAGVPPLAALPIGMAAGSLPFFARPQNVFSPTGGSVREGNVRALTEAGVPVTPGQELGNPSAQVFESVMRYLPTSAPTVAKAEDTQMRAWTRNLLKQAGIESDIATPEVLTKGRQDFRKTYDSLEKRTPQPSNDPQLFDDLLNIEKNYVVGFPDTIKPVYKARVDEVLKYATGEKTGDGKTYHRLQSELSEEIARASRSTDPSAGYFLEAMKGLQGALANAMERAAPEGLKEEWRDVNRKYAIFSRIEDTMARAGQDKLNTGFIPPQQIAAVERVRNPRAFVEGGDPFTDLVRAGAAVLPDPVPNSGTAQRTFAQDILTGGKRGAPVAAAGGAANVAGVAAIDPLLSLGIPYFVAKQWYAPRLSPEMQGILGIQSLGGAMNAE